jgi:hypothetical protein
MRRLVASFVLSLGLALVAVVPAFASDPGGPCSDAHPGNSGYARNHITVLAHAGLLGNTHKPGEHHGYAGLCGVHS